MIKNILCGFLGGAVAFGLFKAMPEVNASSNELSLEDRAQIEDVISRYVQTWDTRDVEGWLALYTEDAVQPVYFQGEKAVEVTSTEQRRQIADNFFPDIDRQGIISTRHFQTNSLFEKQSDGSVKGTTWYVEIRLFDDPDADPLVRTGEYRDVFVKTDQGWKFARREIHLDNPRSDADRRVTEDREAG